MSRTSSDYVELHMHSAYSFLQGASLPEELLLKGAELGYNALALTDRNGLYGSLSFAHMAREWGVQPITGATLQLADGDRLLLLACSREGYARLCRLLTEAHTRSPRLHPVLPWESLQGRTEGLIALAGGYGSRLAEAIERGDRAEAYARACRYRDLFGTENLFLELQRNLVRGERERCKALGDLAEHLGLGTVATGNVHYHCRERHRLHDVLTAIRYRTTLDGCHRQRLPNSEFFLKPPAEVASLFRDRPEAIRNSRAIAERCADFDLTRDLGYVFPDFHSQEGVPADEELARFCAAALEERYADQERTLYEEARQRLAEELRLIRHHSLSGFFLVYRDLIELAGEVAAEVRGGRPRGRFHLPPGRGRGSSVSSIVCYLLGLSHVDPVRARLFLGRFLNDEMGSVPDIDLDFPREIRDRLIERVYERYGREHAGLVASFPTYRLRSAIREVGKALGLPAPALDQLARLSERRAATDLWEEMSQLDMFRNRVDQPPWRDLIAIAAAIDRFPRHLSQHVGGMIISSTPLVEIVPLQPGAIPGRLLCQWDKDACAEARFVKIDFLSLGMLSAVEECLDLIVASGKEPIDLSRIPLDDEAVYDQIAAGDTVGLFQIESRAQIQMLRRNRPRNLEELAIEVAIVRPGPIVGGAVNPYLRRREAWRRDPSYRPPLHPLLEEALGETFGVILYQDQVLQVCQALAGFSAGQADALRRAMNRRRSEETLDRFWEAFRAGAAGRGVDEGFARTVFDQIVAFSAFGFPKSHAAAFALLAYQSAWLRHYYPAEYTAAILNNQPMGFYPLDTLIQDARRHGIRILRPHVNRSEAGCTVERGAVRLGLAFVRGIGPVGANLILRERERGGPFTSLGDFARRVPLNEEAVERLIAVGGFDFLGLRRRELLWQFGLFVRPVPGGKGSVQLPLPLRTGPERVRLPAATPWEQLIDDYEGMNLSPQYHPIGLLRPLLPRGVAPAGLLERLPDGIGIRVAGMVIARQRPQTAKGYIFLLMGDETGSVNVVIRPDLYRRRRNEVRNEPLLLAQGRLERREGSIHLIASELERLAYPKRRPPEAIRTSSRPPGRNAGEGARSVRQAAARPYTPDALARMRLLAPPARSFH